MNKSNDIPDDWAYRNRGLPGAERAECSMVMFGPATMPDGRFEDVAVIDSESASPLGNAWVMADGDSRAVRDPDGVLSWTSTTRPGCPPGGSAGSTGRVAGLSPNN